MYNQVYKKPDLANCSWTYAKDMGKKKSIQWKNINIRMCIPYTFISNAYFIRIFQLFLYTKPISPYSKERLDHIFFFKIMFEF